MRLMSVGGSARLIVVELPHLKFLFVCLLSLGCLDVLWYFDTSVMGWLFWTGKVLLGPG